MQTDTERKIKTFLESWNLRGGELDMKASCQVCGRDLVDGKFAMIDGVLMCLECKDGTQKQGIGGAERL